MRIGEYQDLKVMRETQNGFYLADAEAEVLLPRGQCPSGISIGDTYRVFVLTDSEDRPIATTKRPYATVGQFAKLRVISVADAGAFLDWGLDKDLFCPMREQIVPLKEGDEYLVRIYLDLLSRRVACTTMLEKFLRPTGEGLKPGQPVKVMIASLKRDVVSVIIDDAVRGSLFPDEWHDRLAVGEVREGFVKSVRTEDQKVAVSLRPQGYHAVLGERDRILSAIRANGGFLPVTDRSSPEEIHRRFGLSKGAFKKLIGTMYKEGQIKLESHGIRVK